MKNICLIGFMGAGKSSVAEEIAAVSGRNVFELDTLIIEKCAMSISDIFEKKGESFFRDAESSILESLAHVENAVLSCGGGIVLREKNTCMLKTIGAVVFLHADAATVYERVKNSSHRPLLKDSMDVERIQKLMKERAALYDRAAHITIQTDGLTIEQIAKKIIDMVDIEK